MGSLVEGHLVISDAGKKSTENKTMMKKMNIKFQALAVLVSRLYTGRKGHSDFIHYYKMRKCAHHRATNEYTELMGHSSVLDSVYLNLIYFKSTKYKNKRNHNLPTRIVCSAAVWRML